MTVDLKNKSLPELLALQHVAQEGNAESSKDKLDTAKRFNSARFALTKKIQNARGNDREVLFARRDRLDAMAAESAQEHGKKQAAAHRMLDTINRAILDQAAAANPKLEEPSARGIFRPGREIC